MLWKGSLNDTKGKLFDDTCRLSYADQLEPALCLVNDELPLVLVILKSLFQDVQGEKRKVNCLNVIGDRHVGEKFTHIGILDISILQAGYKHIAVCRLPATKRGDPIDESLEGWLRCNLIRRFRLLHNRLRLLQNRFRLLRDRFRLLQNRFRLRHANAMVALNFLAIVRQKLIIFNQFFFDYHKRYLIDALTTSKCTERCLELLCNVQDVFCEERPLRLRVNKSLFGILLFATAMWKLSLQQNYLLLQLVLISTLSPWTITHRFLVVVCVPIKQLRWCILWHVELQEFFQFVSELGRPLLGTKCFECVMLERVLHVG